MANKYRFWYYLTNPTSLTYVLEHEEQYEKVKGYKTRVLLVLLTTLLVFAARNIWGMHTEGLTTLFAEGFDDRYLFARLMSLVGAFIWAILFFVFHYFILTYVLHVLTDIPSQWIRKIQLYVIFFIVIEKLITFIVFAFAGFTTPLTFFSLAPMTAYFLQEEFVLYFINQLSVATIITIIVQYTFFSQWEEGNKKALLTKLIVVQVVLALLVAAVSILPIYSWIQGGLG